MRASQLAEVTINIGFALGQLGISVKLRMLMRMVAEVRRTRTLLIVGAVPCGDRVRHLQRYDQEQKQEQ